MRQQSVHFEDEETMSDYEGEETVANRDDNETDNTEREEIDYSLPAFSPSQPVTFQWGDLTGDEVMNVCGEAYEKIVQWKSNLFKLPSGRQGKAFVNELASLFRSYAETSAIERIALKLAMILPALVLQKPFRTSKTRDHILCMERRLSLWREGKFKALIEEAQAIQDRLPTTRNMGRRERVTTERKFADLMMQGRLRGATRLLSDGGNGNVLSLDTMVDETHTVRDILHEKHPESGSLSSEAVVNPTSRISHPIIFQEITGTTILESALHTEGGAGPSGLDAQAWRRLCTSFQKASNDLCEAVAMTARKIGSTFVDPEPLQPLIACRLVALDKCPGVRPVGIGEVSRRIISKAILVVIREDIREVVQSRQLCVGQRSGCEAAVHALNQLYNEGATEGVITVDARNAFNTLNRKAALTNALHLCPSLATVLINTYRSDPPLFIEGETIISKEGTTQGDPLAMAMYAIGTLPLIQHLEDASDAKQVWYADDSAAGGGLSNLREWWDKIVEMGPIYGYFVNPSKTWLVVKEDLYDEAQRLFQDTDIKITMTGRSYLGSTIGNDTFKDSFVAKKVNEWSMELKKLAGIARSQPHSAYCALTLSLKSKWLYLVRTTDDISDQLQPVEDIIRFELIPAICGKANISDDERRLFALPTRLGGLGIDILPDIANRLHQSSRRITEPLQRNILGAESNESGEIEEKMADLQRSTKEENRRAVNEEADEISSHLSHTTRRGMELAQEKGASSWLTTLPIEEHGYALHKGAFRDAIALRYGWRPESMPSVCVCGKTNDVSHALTCGKGGYVIHRHNEIRDTTASLLKEAPRVHSVEVEPQLQPLTGEELHGRTANVEDASRLDLKCKGFWNCSQDAFFDVRVCNPLASSYQNLSTEAMLRRNEREKQRAYEQRVREVEHGSFTPLVFAVTGGMGPSASIFYKRLASLIAQEKNRPYCQVISWMRSLLRFCLLRAAIMAIRGSRSAGRPSSVNSDRIVLSMAEGHVSVE